MQCIEQLEQKLVEIKTSLQDVLVLLEMQDAVNYPQLLNSLYHLSLNFSNIQDKMRKALLPSGT